MVLHASQRSLVTLPVGMSSVMRHVLQASTDVSVLHGYFTVPIHPDREFALKKTDLGPVHNKEKWQNGYREGLKYTEGLLTQPAT